MRTHAIAIILAAALLVGCDEEAPTELNCGSVPYYSVELHEQPGTEVLRADFVLDSTVWECS